jgi:hypothetical protein
VTFKVPFDQAPAQRLVDAEGRPYWIEIRRGNDLVTDMSITNGFTQAAWILRWSARRAAWALHLSARTWRVLEFSSKDGFKQFPAVRDQVTSSRYEAVALAESWRTVRA